MHANDLPVVGQALSPANALFLAGKKGTDAFSAKRL
jgi:hypothetical protein